MQPISALHYAPNANFAFGSYDAAGDPGAAGFNLADVSSVAAADALPDGVQGLIWLGDTSGLTPSFENTVNAAANDPKVYGFYVADEPADNVIGYLAQEDAYIAEHAPGKVSFIVALNDGTPTNPYYAVTPQNTGADLIGLDPYPVRSQFSGGMDLSVIDAAVSAAESVGWSLNQIIPVYQAFGGGGYTSWTLPTADQEEQILSEWGNLTPNPDFDYAYSWGTQNNDDAIANTSYLQTVFSQHNAGTTSVPSPTSGTSPTSVTDDEFVSGTVSGQIVENGGTQHVTSGGMAVDTTINGGGSQYLLNGGTAISTLVNSGGVQYVDSGGVATNDLLAGGQEYINAGGTASASVINGGSEEIVSSGGWDTAASINSGGSQIIYGETTATDVYNGGAQYVEAGGVTQGTTLSLGGNEIVYSGGTASNTNINGGTLEIAAGGLTGGYVNFGSSGNLLLDASVMFTGQISGFTRSDIIDLRDIAFGSATTLQFIRFRHGGNELIIDDGTHTTTIDLIGHYKASQFSLASDGSGGTIIQDPPANNVVPTGFLFTDVEKSFKKGSDDAAIA